MGNSGMNMTQVGYRNRSAILSYVNKIGAMSRKNIAEATGLTPAAVTQISAYLIKEGILVEMGTIDGDGAGRKQVMLDIDYNSRYVISVNIEQTQTVIAICNIKGEAKARKKLATDTSVAPEEFLTRVANESKKLMESMVPSTLKKLSAVSVAIPGIVNRDAGVAEHAYGIWNEPVPVADILTGKLNYPCIVSNNVDAFAKASSIYGIGRNYDNILVIKWGPGVGGTILIDNKVYDGRHGKAAEFGHFIVHKNGRKCNCGRKGCLETVVSYSALNEVVAFDEGKLYDAYMNATDTEKAKLDEAIELFARSIVNTITVLAPDRVILCGFLFKEENIRKKFMDAVKEFDPSITERRILYTELSEKEDYIGPVASYFNQFIESGM